MKPKSEYFSLSNSYRVQYYQEIVVQSLILVHDRYFPLDLNLHSDFLSQDLVHQLD